MFGISDYPTLVATTFVFLALPGPGTLALLHATAHGGWRAGAAATGGLMAADQLLLWFAVGGVAAALLVRPALLALLQGAGALYLGWVGITLMIERSSPAAESSSPAQLHHARRAFLITLLNPKALFFYVAFIPLFVDPARHRGAETFLAIAVTVAAITAFYCLTLCALAGRLSAWFGQRPAAGRWLRRAAGVALLGFGIQMLL